MARFRLRRSSGSSRKSKTWLWVAAGLGAAAWIFRKQLKEAWEKMKAKK